MDIRYIFHKKDLQTWFDLLDSNITIKKIIEAAKDHFEIPQDENYDLLISRGN